MTALQLGHTDSRTPVRTLPRAGPPRRRESILGNNSRKGRGREGDSTEEESSVNVRPLRKPDIKEILELLSYIPLTPSAREERQRLVGSCRLRAIELNGGPFSSWEEAQAATAKVVDLDTALELRGLRCTERIYYDVLEPILGKGTVDWRLMMCLEAGYNHRAREELDLMVLRAERAFDYEELERFASAMRLLKRAKHGHAAPDKARAVLYFCDAGRKAIRSSQPRKSSNSSNAAIPALPGKDTISPVSSPGRSWGI